MDELKRKVLILLYIIGIIISGSILSIITPLIVEYISSSFFIQIMTSVELIIIYWIILRILYKNERDNFKEYTDQGTSINKNDNHTKEGYTELKTEEEYLLNGNEQIYETVCNNPYPKYKYYIILGGICSATSISCLVYTSSPERTPIVMQMILSSLAIIPSVLLTKYYLKREKVYDIKYVVLSMILLIAAIVVTTIPIASEWSIMSLVWIMIYILGTCLRSAMNIMQEKYFMVTKNGTYINKFMTVLYMRITHLMVTILLFWVEYVIGYTDDPIEALRESIIEFFSNKKTFLMIEIYFIASICLYVCSVCLNEISTNYNMIASVVITPITDLFYSIFPNLNDGLQYTWLIVIVSMICNSGSVIFWIIGEKNII